LSPTLVTVITALIGPYLNFFKTVATNEPASNLSQKEKKSFISSRKASSFLYKSFPDQFHFLIGNFSFCYDLCYYQYLV